MVVKALSQISCGREAREEFNFHPEYVNLNHGSYGTCPRSVLKLLRHHQDLAEQRPDQYIRYDFPKFLNNSRRLVADYVHAPLDTCVLIPNSTTGVNTILRNLVFKPGDVIIYFATIYGSCEKTVAYICESTPAESRKITYQYPVSDDHLCDALEKTINSIRGEGKNAHVAIFDTIVSMPGVRMPFERLTRICRKLGTLSLIDGAHGVGQIPLNLTELDPDFFVSNCHKWLYVPRGTALFYVPLRNQKLMRSTLPTSHGFVPLTVDGSAAALGGDENDFIKAYEFYGTLDSTPYACVPAALEWRSRLTFDGKVGEEAVYTYLQHLARRAATIVSEALDNAPVMENEDGTLGNCAFANIRLPLSYEKVAGKDYKTGFRVWTWMNETMLEDYKTFVPIIFYNEEWWVRISAQVYLGDSDMVWAGQMLRDLCKRAENGEWRNKLPLSEAEV